MRLNAEAELKELQRELERSGAAWRAGRTCMFGLSRGERRRRLGCVPGPDEPSFEEREADGDRNQDFLRPEGPLTYRPYCSWARACFGNTCGDAITAGDQGNCGSCVSFAVAGTLLMRAQIDFDQWFNDAGKNQTVVSPAYLFYCIAAGQGRDCNTGWWNSSAIDAVISGGAPKWQYFPYTPGDQPCNVRTPWTGWGATSRQTLSDTTAMKEYISAHGPVATSFTVYSDFYDYKSGVYKKSSGATPEGGHAVCVVGYDDEKAAWQCVNSWGWDWGEYGFFWIGYGQCGIDSAMDTMDGIVNAQSA